MVNFNCVECGNEFEAAGARVWRCPACTEKPNQRVKGRNRPKARAIRAFEKRLAYES